MLTVVGVPGTPATQQEGFQQGAWHLLERL